MPVKPGGGALEITARGGLGHWSSSSRSDAAQPGGLRDETCATRSPSTASTTATCAAAWRAAGASCPRRRSSRTRTSTYADLLQRHEPRGASLLRASAGLAGLVSPKIAVTRQGGLGPELHAAGGGSFLAQLEAHLPLTPDLELQGRLPAHARAGGRLTASSATTAASPRAGCSGGGKLTAARVRRRRLPALRQRPRPTSCTAWTSGPEYQFRPWLCGAAGYMLELAVSSVTARRPQLHAPRGLCFACR